MFKFTIVLCAAMACAAAHPGLLAPVAYSSPLIATGPGIVTATSSQVVARNYNGVGFAPVAVAAPVAKVVAAPLAYSAPLVAAPVAKYVSAPVAYTAAAPLGYAAAPLGYAAAPFAAKYVSPLGYAAPASYFI